MLLVIFFQYFSFIVARIRPTKSKQYYTRVTMRVLAIGAHPDDIEIACSGTLAKCVKRGDTVIVCHVSSGNLGHVVIPPDERFGGRL